MGDFSLQSTSTCRNSGKHQYDLGAIYFDDINSAATFLQLAEGTTQSEVRIRWKNSNQTVHGNSLDTIKSVQIWRNDELVQEIFTSNLTDTLEYVDVIGIPDYYRYLICTVDINDRMGQMQYHTVEWLGGPIEGIVIIELDTTPITGPAIATCLQELGYNKPVYFAQNTSRYPLEATVDAVFLPVGIYPNNHVLGNEEALVLKDYLELGGRIYMEGGDTWYFDPQTILQPMFNILPVGDGTSDLDVIVGNTGTFTEGMGFNYIGENSYIDHIDPIAPAFTIFSNYSPAYNCAVAYSSGTYKTIGASFEFGGLQDGSFPSTKTELLKKILEFFDIVIPVELLSFNFYTNEENVILNWRTATELNNKGFEIERASSLTSPVQDWVKIGFIEGHGTTTEKQDYTFTDNTLSSKGTYYYRLKQVDYDGSFEYSEILEIDYNGVPTSFTLSQNYPNPFNSSTVIKYSIPAEGIVTIKVYNVLGEEVTTLVNEVKQAGRYEIDFDASALSSGLYFYRLQTGDASTGSGQSFTETKKMLLLK